MSTLAKLLMGVGGEPEPVPDEPGTPYGGGFYAGRIMANDGKAYALVVSPKAQGEALLQWKTENTLTGVSSRNNGWSHTIAMTVDWWDLNSAHPIALFCRGLVINGYNDWYVPAQDELEILYRAFKPTTWNNVTNAGYNSSAIPPTGNYTTDNPSQTVVEAFKQGGEEAFAPSHYWSSTEATANGAKRQDFTYGIVDTATKTTSNYVRAVRRVAI